MKTPVVRVFQFEMLALAILLFCPTSGAEPNSAHLGSFGSHEEGIRSRAYAVSGAVRSWMDTAATRTGVPRWDFAGPSAEGLLDSVVRLVTEIDLVGWHAVLPLCSFYMRYGYSMRCWDLVLRYGFNAGPDLRTSLGRHHGDLFPEF